MLDSAESFYKLRLTPDREFIIQRSTACLKDHYPKPYGPPDFTTRVWCPLAHEGRPFGSLFWCDCPCHGKAS